MFPWNLDSGRALDYTYSVRHRYGAPNFHGLTGLCVLPVCIKKAPLLGGAHGFVGWYDLAYA